MNRIGYLLACAFLLCSNSTFSQVRQITKNSSPKEITDTEILMRSTLKEDFGGVWIDRETGSLVVGVTDARLSRLALANGVVPVKVDVNEARLKSAIDQLNRSANKRPAGLVSWHIDIEENQVVLGVLDGKYRSNAVSAWAARAGAPFRIEINRIAPALLPPDDPVDDGPGGGGVGGPVIGGPVVGGPIASSPAGSGGGFGGQDTVPHLYFPIIGGAPLYGVGRCSIAFSGWNTTTGKKYVLTAGHCGDGGLPYKYEHMFLMNNVYYTSGLQTIGSTFYSKFPGSDYRLIEVQNMWAATSRLVDMWRYDYVKAYGFSTTAPLPAGAQVCSSGSTTGWRCGAIISYNYNVCVPQGCVNNMVLANFCSYPGDSGGSVVAAGVANSSVAAQGIVSGRVGFSCGADLKTFYQPIAPVLQQHNLMLHYIMPPVIPL